MKGNTRNWRQMKLAVFIAALPAIFLPSLALADAPAQYVSVSPAEVSIDNLPPGEAAEFELTILNQEETARVFVLTLFQPPEKDRRQGRAEFPDDSWISFSSPEIVVAAQSEASVEVTVAIPLGQEWAGKDWEVWLGVAAESSQMLIVKSYVRLFVSTRAATEARPNPGLVVGIAAAAILLGYGACYCFRRRTRLR